MECYLKFSVIQKGVSMKNGMSLRIECNSKWISLKMQCHSDGMLLKMECQSNWNVTQIGMSLKFEYHPN